MAAGPGNALRAGEPGGLLVRVAAFLAEHALSPDPANYAIAYDTICNPGSERARAVRALTQDGVRLSSADVERLGGTPRSATMTLVPRDAPRPPRAAEPERDDVLVTRALAQIDGFSETLHAIHSDTNDFGRDLAETAAEMQVGGVTAGAERVAQLTAAMIERVQLAESRLEQARDEAAELRAALEEARTSAQTDPLTELPNRRAFDNRFAALDPGTPVALAICDIDFFKRVNDAFGHVVGDRVLKLVAQLLEREVGCTVARYGGEEFAVLFERDDVAVATARIQGARDAITARRLRDRDTDRPIGTINFSAGVALGQAGDTLTSLMERADRALYAAKQAGRGQTVVAP